MIRNRIETHPDDIDYDWHDQLIEIAIQTVRGGACSGNLPINLFTDLFDCKSIANCEKLFTLLEKRVDTWKEKTFYDQMKNIMLRCCNDLLRRLSKSQNAVFGGRILELIARFFPLFERSGLNTPSEFNLENAIVLSQEEIDVVDKEEDEQEMETDNDEYKTATIKVDYNFYRKFWHLHTFFKSPNTVYTKANWKQLQSYTTDVLNVFTNHKIDSSSNTGFRFFDNSDMNCNDSEESLHFTRYLTSKKVLDLQLGDSCFRRYILVQLLILFQYLTSQVRTRPESLTLSDDQIEWVNQTTEKVYHLIEETPPKGKEMRNCVEHILARESFWNIWKNEMCPNLKSVNEAPAELPPKISKTRLGDEVKAADRCGKVIIGNQDLTKIWNQCQDNWDACLSEERIFTPPLEKFFEPVITRYETWRPEDRQKILIEESDFTWRALRLLSQKSSHFFTPSNLSQVRPINQYLDAAIEKVVKELAPVHVDGSRSLHDLAIQDAEDISNDELLKQMDDSSNLAPTSEQNTPEATSVA